ncbi:MAG TPA: hypothetical protein VM510_02535, partial [Caulifigura sp.]|nr:hypothetical protein [Caulifigura sp.]
MNLRHPKVIRLFGWGALITTLLLVAAGGFLAFTFFQSGEMLYCGLGAGITLASLVIGGLLTYGCFLLAGMTAESGGASAVLQTAAASGEEVDSAVTEIASADDTIAIPPAELEIGSPAPEYSDDAIPVFQAVPDESSDAGFPEESSDAGTEDFFVEDLLVVPPPITLMEDSDVTANAPVDVVDDFDSRMDLPVTIDASADIAAPESSDDVEPAPVEHSQTEAIVSAVTPTAEFDAVAEVPATAKKTPVEPATPASTTPVPAVPAVPSLTDAFPDIFKTPPATPAVPAAVVTAPVSTATPVPSVVAPAPAPAMAPAAAKAPAMLPAAKPPKPVVEARPA